MDTDPDLPSQDYAASFDHVQKSFDEHVILRDLVLNISAGEKVSLIGPSGSGKTTILRILAGLERPDHGQVRVFGDSLWHMTRRGRLIPASAKHLRAASRDVGIVYQMFNLFPHMNVLRNITEAPIRTLNYPRKRAHAEARELLDMVGLAGFEQSYPAQLSGGQQQRVAIARTLAMHPKMLLFDEVTSALDPELVGEVMSVVRQLGLRSEITMIIVTHEMSLAAHISDRVLMLDDGQIIEDGPPEQVLSNPRSPRTRKFLSAVLNPLGETSPPLAAEPGPPNPVEPDVSNGSRHDRPGEVHVPDH